MNSHEKIFPTTNFSTYWVVHFSAKGFFRQLIFNHGFHGVSRIFLRGETIHQRRRGFFPNNESQLTNNPAFQIYLENLVDLVSIGLH